MKLKIEFIDEDTDRVFIVKNKHDAVFYHDSNIHDPSEFQKLTDSVKRFNKDQHEVINMFYSLSSKLM